MKINNKFIKKTIAVTTSIATTLSVSSVSLLMPVFTATAVTINEGDTIKTADSFDVWIVKHMGTKKFKRLILNPDVFNSYGHLSWAKIKTVSSAEAAMYTESKLVRAVGDPKVYELSSAANSDTGVKKWVNMTAAEFVAAGNDWDSIYEINTVDRDNYTVASDITPTTPTTTPVPTTGKGVEVSFASDTPVAGSVAMGSQDVVFTKLNFKGNENTTVTAITVLRGGLANDTDLSAVKLWDGSTQLGSTQAINTTTHQAIFTGLNWVVPVGLTKVLTISGSIAGTGTATTSTAPALGIATKTDVTADKEISGAFPLMGKGMTIAGLAIGRLDVVVRTVPADQSPISGSTDQEIASWTFSAVSEGMSVRKIKITQIGSAGTADISNVKLKINGVQIGITVASLASDGTATFDLASAPLAILSGTNKIIYAHADIASGINTSRTVRFEITNATDVTAFGTNSGGSVTITGDAGATFSAQTGTVQTISQATVLSVTTNGATNPSAQTFVRGATQQLITAFRFSAGAGEDQRATRIKLSLGGTGADATDLSNVTLYKYDSTAGTEIQVGTATSFVGTIATYGLNTTPTLDPGLFDVPKNTNYILHVRADVTSAASWTGLGIFMNEVRIDGLTSKADIAAATITSVDVIGEVTTHSAHATVGTITMSLSPSSKSAQNVVPGTVDFEFARVDFTMANEPATLSSVTVNLYDGAAPASGDAGNAESADFTNVKLWDVTGGAKTQLGTTSATPSTSASFSFNVTIPKDKTVSVAITSDIPTNAFTVAWNSSTSAVSIDADITATGVWSAATVTDPSTDVIGNLMTALQETLTVSFQTVPSTTVIVNAAQAVISRMILVAGTAGDVRVSSIKFTASSSTTLNTGGASRADTEFGTLKLLDGATQLGTVLSAFTNAAGGDTATFTGLSLTIPKGTSKLLDLKANVLAAGDGTAYIGVLDLTAAVTDIVATGLASNQTIYGTGTDSDDSGAITLAAAGNLLVEVDAGTPNRGYVAVGATGKTGVDFVKFKVTAGTSTAEAVDVERIAVTLQANSDSANNTQTNDIPNLASLSLYNGTTRVSSVEFPSGTNASSAATSTFTFGTWSGSSFTSVPLRIAKGASVVLTLKADMNGTSNGANSSTTPRFFLFDVGGSTDGSATVITARGVDSGARLNSQGGASTKNPATATNFNDLVVVKSKPIFALCTAANCSKATPSGALGAGVIDVLRFRITAEGDDVIFRGPENNLRFRYSQSVASGNYWSSRTLDFYEQGVGTVLETMTLAEASSTVTAGTANSYVDFDHATTTITTTGYKEYYLRFDVPSTVFDATGESLRFDIENAAADLSWGDGVSRDVSEASITEGLPIQGSTLSK